MLVKSIMTTPVVTTQPNTTLGEAIGLLVGHHLSALAVLDDTGQLCGILSEGDLLRRIELGTDTKHDHWWSPLFSTEGLAGAFRKANGRRVSDVMTNSPITVDAEDTLADAASLMEKHHVKRLPVMHESALVGMLSRADFIRVLAQFVAPAYEEQATSDSEIKKRILAGIAGETWSLPCRIAVAVKEGHVALAGYVPSDDHRAAARVVAENVIGVSTVDDQIVVSETLPVYAL